MLNSRERRKARRAAERKMEDPKPSSSTKAISEPSPSAPTHRYRLRLSPKEWVLLLIGTALALGSLPGSDPEIVLPMIVVSWFAFLWLFLAHSGNLGLRILGAVVITVVLGWIGFRLYKQSQPLPVAVANVKEPAEPFLNPFEHPCERMLVFNTPDTVKRTYVAAQLFPPTCEGQQAISTPVSQLKIQFRNLGTSVDRNVSLRIKVPLANKVTCEGDRIKIVSGPDPDKSVLAGIVHFIAPELVPEEAHTCEISFPKTIAEGTPTKWRRVYGIYKATSDLHMALDVDLHRVHFGAIQESHNPKVPYDRAITKEVN